MGLSQHLYQVFIFLTVFLLLPQSGIGEEKIPAADLIGYGQEIAFTRDTSNLSPRDAVVTPKPPMQDLDMNKLTPVNGAIRRDSL
jgi:hypothetical protein